MAPGAASRHRRKGPTPSSNFSPTPRLEKLRRVAVHREVSHDPVPASFRKLVSLGRIDFMKTFGWTLVLGIGLWQAGCGSSESAPTPPAATLDASSDGAAVSPLDGGSIPMAVMGIDSMERVPGSRAFDVHFSANTAVELLVDRGTVGPILAGPGKGQFVARVEPSSTGRHTVTLRSQGSPTGISRTALVLPSVDDSWNQPEPVAGMVNTAGWEDGANVTPNGQWLIVQYLPIPIDCFVGGDINAPLCKKALGPVGPPERPRLPGASRVAADGTITYGCPKLGAPALDFPVAPNSLYAFLRTGENGFHFSSPHPVYYDHADGCVSAFGMALIPGKTPGTWDTVFALDSPLDYANDSFADLFAGQLTLGDDVVLGNFEWNGDSLALANHVGVSIGHPLEGAEGNPWAWKKPGDGYAVFYDDEQSRDDLFVIETSGSLTAGPWSDSVRVPEPVSIPGEEESQPYFDGKTLYFRRGLRILASDWNGGAFGDSGSWSTARTILGDDATAIADGNIVGVGEPSVAERDGRKELYFVFVERLADHLNLDIGVVPAR